MAPSVRVKRSEYSNLGEPRRDTHPLTSIFIPPNPQNPENSTPQLRVDSPTPQVERNVSTLPSRQRSSTFGSIVHRHCRRSRSLATSRLLDQDGQESIASTSHGAPSQGGSAASYTSRPRYLSVQGEENVGFAARTAPVTGRRRAGTVLSITTSNQDSSLLPDDDETHHHDDIVEHLDVIGMLQLPYLWTLHLPMSYTRSTSGHSLELNQRRQLYCIVRVILSMKFACPLTEFGQPPTVVLLAKTCRLPTLASRPAYI